MTRKNIRRYRVPFLINNKEGSELSFASVSMYPRAQKQADALVGKSVLLESRKIFTLVQQGNEPQLFTSFIAPRNDLSDITKESRDSDIREFVLGSQATFELNEALYYLGVLTYKQFKSAQGDLQKARNAQYQDRRKEEALDSVYGNVYSKHITLKDLEAVVRDLRKEEKERKTAQKVVADTDPFLNATAVAIP